MLSHYRPEERAKVERSMVRSYYDHLTGLNPDIRMTWEECWQEYVFGGAGKFFWFLPMLVTMCPPKMGQFFVDQVQHFVMTHGITAETAPMPRA